MSKVTGKITPLRDNVLVCDMNFEEQVTKSGIIIKSDDGKVEGVKPRWGRVWAVGPKQTDVKVGDWILIEHGRWTRGITVEDENGDEVVIRWAETKAIMMATDEKPSDLSFGANAMPSHGDAFTPDQFLRK